MYIQRDREKEKERTNKHCFSTLEATAQDRIHEATSINHPWTALPRMPPLTGSRPECLHLCWQNSAVVESSTSRLKINGAKAKHSLAALAVAAVDNLCICVKRACANAWERTTSALGSVHPPPSNFSEENKSA